MADLIGVDEAGRGPVLGSMFVAAVSVADEGAIPNGVRDSKQLSNDHRHEVATLLEADSAVRTAIVEVSPDQIDAAAGRLNQLTATAAGNAIEAVLPTDPDDLDILVDACDTDEARYASHVAGGLDTPTSITATHRADETEPIVAAASIVAKERREAHVADLRERYGDIGSGYPSDPTTRTYLAQYVEEHRSPPSCARQTWKTCADLLTAHEQGTLSEF